MKAQAVGARSLTRAASNPIALRSTATEAAFGGGFGMQARRGGVPGGVPQAGGGPVFFLLESTSPMPSYDLMANRELAERAVAGGAVARPPAPLERTVLRSEAPQRERSVSLGRSDSDLGSASEGQRGRSSAGRPAAEVAQSGASAAMDADSLRREKNRVQQMKFRAKKKRRAQELESYVVELQEKAQHLIVRNAELERENNILWAHVEHLGGPARPAALEKMTWITK
ncbi:unnamed protein product [Ostreobium quekettii]|uniref:BZIP domain-containing protein n=1 Tax=Ostreobium quekettii TaxID=121088 RepID=A0A8S1ITQ7_9CHLO|nr:unnamed protein product [Ostreobium quekettii]